MPALPRAATAQAKGPVLDLVETSQSHSSLASLKTSFSSAACRTCQGARTAWAPGSARQCSPRPKKKASLLAYVMPFRQHPLTAVRSLSISLMEAGAAALP
eukprot:14957846-Heterocapsa_arctica.AAC.1